ncbi:MAG: hypothetical protein IKS46_05980 [Clostridia bacterium]|nr:hypothetical protein [Clostridia bacterium]
MDMKSVILDPNLGCTAFTVERITYTRSREGTISGIRTEQARGCIHPGAPEALKLLPEEEQHETFIEIYTNYPLSTGIPEDAGASFTAPDRIRWNNRTWRVVKVRDWQGFGYCQAYAVLLHDDE